MPLFIKFSTSYKTIILTIIFSIASFTCYSQKNNHPCLAERLCETKSLNNSYPGLSNSFYIKTICSYTYFSRTIFYKLIIKSGNKFTFKIKPEKAADYDWAVWKNIDDCENISKNSPDRFSANDGIKSYPTYTSNWDTGLDISKPESLKCQSNGSLNDGLVAALDVNIGDEILLAINLAQSQNGISDYLLSFGGDSGGGGNADFLCIEEFTPFYICDINNDNIEKNFDLNQIKESIINDYLNGNNNYTIKFYLNEKDLVKNTNSINFIDVTNKGTQIFCNIIKPNNDVYSSLSIDVNLVKFPVGKDIEDTVCLNQVDLHYYDDLLSITPDKTVVYYDDLSKAENEAASLVMPININKKTTFYALIKSNKGKCSIIQKLTLQPQATPQSDPIVICSGKNAVLSVKNSILTTHWYNVPTGGNPIFTGSVFSLGIQINNGKIPVIKTYYVEQEDSGCISERIPVTVTVNPQLSVDLGADRSICQGSTTVLDAGNTGSTYLWSTGATTQSIEVNQTGTYSVVVTDANGCQGSGSIKITVNALPVVNLGADRSICQGSSTTLDAGNAGSTYLWSTGAITQSIEVTQAGTYSVVVTDTNGCQGKGSIKVTVNALPVVNLGADRSICQGSSTILDAGNTGSTYLWSTGATTQSIEVTQAGTYSVVVTDANGCQGSDEIKITVNPLPVVNLGADRSICQGSTTVLDAGNTGSTYLWSTGATTQSIEVTQAGTYSVVVTDANGCQGSDEIKISINPQLSVDLGADLSICQGSSTTLDAGNAGSTYLWSTGATTQSIEVNQAGTYSVVVTDANGCQGSGSVKVTVNTLPVVNLGADRSICQGSSTTLDAGNTGSTYLWSTGATTRSIEVTQAGTYSVVVTDANGCQGSGSVKVTVNTLPVVNLGADRSICQRNTTVLDAGNTGSTYLWSTGATTQSIEVNQAGTYSVVVTDANGCQGSDEIKITVNPLPVVNLGADRSICQGSSTTLDAGNAGSTYLWSTGATTQSIEVNQAGTYSVVVTDANGCQGSDEIKISINPQLSVDLGADRSICQGSTTVLDAGNTGSTYLWSTGATTQSIEVNQAGTYSVVVTDANSCQGSDEIKITVNPLPVVNLGADRSICQGSSTTLDAGNAGSTYLWSTGATTRSIEVTQAGTYSVVVTDANGCQGSGSVKVTVNTLPVVNLGADRSICQGSTTVLDAGNTGSTYLWSTGATTQSIEVTQAGTYSVVVTDANGCQGSGSVKVTVNTLPVVNLGADRSICQGSSTTLDAGNAGSTYLWSSGATTQSIEVTQAGTYSVVVTDTNGCQGKGSIKVTVNALPVVNLGADRSICQGSSTILDAGNTGSTYLWSTGATTQSIEVTQAGTYSVVVTDANGCQGSDSVKITVNALPVVNLGADRSICQRNTTVLDAGNTGSTYLWSTGATTQSIEVTQAGTYSVVVTDANGCQGSDEIKISINPLPVVNLGADRSICQGSTTVLDAGNTGSTYLWSTGATTQSIEVTQAGTYSVVVTDANGCQGSDEIKITVNALLVVNLGADRSICQGSTTVLDAGNTGSTYLWSTGATTQSIEVTQAGTYSVVVTDTNGCQGKGSIKVTVNALPVVNLGADRSICQGSSTILDAGNTGSTYLWSTGATTQSIEVTQAGTYSVVVTDTNGCQGKGSIKITVNALPVVNLGADRSICQGSSTTLDAGNTGSTYLWSTGATTQSIEVNQAGTYSVVVTDANGCQGSDSIKITVNALPVVNLGADRSICQGSTTVVDAGNTGSTYLWSTGATTQSIEVNQTGIYKVTVTNKNGCSSSSSIQIKYYETPQIKEIKINGNDVEVYAIGKAPLEYSLDLINWQSSPFFTGLKPKIYHAYVRNALGCINGPLVFSILDIPNIITPNGDGINDVWHIKGLEIYSGSSITIFDRYGKLLLKQKIDKEFIWDGKYLGRNLPSSSYWYILDLTDGRRLTGWIAIRNHDSIR